jgi:hypothetical protein
MYQIISDAKKHIEEMTNRKNDKQSGDKIKINYQVLVPFILILITFLNSNSLFPYPNPLASKVAYSLSQFPA